MDLRKVLAEDENHDGVKQTELTKTTRATNSRTFGTPLLGSPVSKDGSEEEGVYRDWKNYENYLDKYILNLEETIGPAQYMVISAAIRTGRDSRTKRRQAIENSYIINMVCNHFKFKSDTYFLAVYLATSCQAKSVFEVGVCLFMSDKYEEMYAHKWQEYSEYLGFKTTAADIIEQELLVLRKVNFQVHRPLIHFLTVQYLKSSRASPETVELANMMLKIILLEEAFFKNNITDMALAICSMVLRTVKEQEAYLKFSMLAMKKLESPQVSRFRQSIKDWIVVVHKMKKVEVTEPFIEMAERVLTVLDPKALVTKPLRFDSPFKLKTFSDILN